MPEWMILSVQHDSMMIARICRYKQLLPCALLGWLLVCSAASAQDLRAKMQGALQRVFGESIEIATGSATLNDGQIASIRSATGYGYGSTVQYFAVLSKGKPLGYGIIDEVRGKSKLITYALIVGRDLVIRDLEVLAYREPYGGEIQYDAFRRQFRGKGTRDPLRIGSDIKNISGATISSNSVTNGVRKLMAVLKELKLAGKLN
jgi:hypothetical protein